MEHFADSIMSILKRKSKKEESSIPRVKSMNNFETNTCVVANNRDSVETPETTEVTSNQKSFLGKLLRRTTSMPNIDENCENIGLSNNGSKSKCVNQKRTKNKITNENHVQELVKYLHTDTPVVIYKQELSCEDMELMSHFTPGCDLNKYLEEPSDSQTSNLWKIKLQLSRHSCSPKKSFSECEDCMSANGFRTVRRFGNEVADGCSFPLSLKKEDLDNKSKNAGWSQVLEKSETVLQEFERNRNDRRGSLLQPRVMFISFYPANGWQKVKEIGHCLPLRKWTSELLFESKEGSALLEDDCKRNLKWNASIQSLHQQCTSPTFETPICSSKAPLVSFRRQSYNENVWNSYQLYLQRKVDYKSKLHLFSTHNSLRENYLKTANRKRLKSIFEESEVDSKKDVIQFGLLSPSNVAFTLTSIVRELFLTIKSDEVFRMLSSKPIDQENCPGITALLGFQKRILNLLTTSILDLPTVQERAKRIAFLIEVAEQLRFTRNWQSLFSIICSCQSPPIARLKHTWSYFFQNYSDHYREFLSLSREIMETNVESENTMNSTQCIPIFDKWLHQLKHRCILTTDKCNSHTDKGHWQKPETIALWLNNEIITLEKLALEGKTHKKMQDKKKGIVHKIKKTFSHKPKNDKHHEGNISEGSELSGQTNVIKSEINSCDKKSMHNKDNRQASQTPNTSDDSETRKFRIITDALNECHMKLVGYNLENNETARNYLLLQSYRSMDENMSISYAIEPVHR